MRFDRLGLHCYGHLSEVALAFPPHSGLHVVLGANEAGKSTALAAIGDALFGFAHRTDYAFQFDARDLRLSFAVRARDGRAGDFVRLKRRRDDLLDGADRPLPETALAAFLGGATRERFDRVFGLDAAELRRGGAAILEGKGEVGESILQAHTGLSFRPRLAQIDEAASQLHGDRRRRRESHVAVEAFKQAKQALDARSVEPAAYKEQRAAQLRLTDLREANAREAEALHAERTRLERIRRTAPALRARTLAVQQRDALGEVASLPADAEARRQDATLKRDRARHDLDGLRARDAELAAGLAALVVDDAMLADGEAVAALAADVNRIEAARRDRAQQRAVATQRQQAMEAGGRRLGLRGDAATLAAAIPSALARGAADRAAALHERLATRQHSAAEEQQTTAQGLAAAEAAVAAAAEAVPFVALREAIEAAKAEGRIDDELRQHEAAAQAAAAELARALAALPLWSGPAADLASAPVPLEAMQTRHDAALQAAATALRTCQERHAACEKALAEIAAALRDLTQAGDLPTAEAIAALRDQRDRTWRQIRRHVVDPAAGPVPPDLPDALEQQTRAADALADRRASDAERVATFEHLRARQASQQAQADAAAADEAAARADHDAALAAWRALWLPCGIVADSPEVMRDWQRRRDAVLALLAREGEAARKLSVLRARHAAAMAALAAQLGVAAEGRLADLLRAAALVCGERERADSARAKALARLEEVRAAADKAARGRARLDAEMQAWRADWAPVAASLGLPPDAAAADGKQALELWNDIEAEYNRWRAAEDRVADMTRAIDGFTDQAASLIRRLAPDLADTDPDEAVRALAGRLAAARAAAAERQRQRDERAKVQAALAKAAAAHDAAEATLSGLRGLAGAADDAALQDAIARAARHAELSRLIAERDGELAREDRPAGDLAAEAEGVDLDSLPGRLAAIEERLRAIAEENAAGAGKLAAIRAGLDEMEHGRDAAGAAQDMQNALADLDDIAARYVRLRLAHTLLRAGIDRFRRQQQGPLLGRAGGLFARLTEGRYHRLSVDEDEQGRLTLVALRPDGGDCPADRLSEGTRDQLYLALRLAAIESYAERAEPLPFIADDLLVNFDDRRALAALRVLAEFGQVAQTILFTHHHHLFDLAGQAGAALHRLEQGGLVLA